MLCIVSKANLISIFNNSKHLLYDRGTINAYPWYAYFESKKSCKFVAMFTRLQKKWNVGGRQLFLVLFVFAIGGSATGYLGKMIMDWFSIDKGWLWTVIYIMIVTLIWPLNVIAVSIPFGQFSFFTKYLQRLGSSIMMRKKKRTNNSATEATRIAIFASGTGSNARKIIDHFRHHPSIAVGLIACNKPGAGVLAIAESEKIPALLLDKEKFFRQDGYAEELRAAGINFIVLAGFLWKIPQPLIEAFRNRIINIHPALLPKYGGKGMYGNAVHEAVINAGDEESGITIHFVDEHYDNGDIIFQARVDIDDDETPESLAEKIHALEHSNFPRVIEQLIIKPNGS